MQHWNGNWSEKASQALLIKMEFKKFSLSLSLSLDFWSFVLKYVWKLQKHNILCPAVSVSDFMDKSWMCGKSIKYVKCQLFVGNGWNIAIPWEAQIWRGGKRRIFFGMHNRMTGADGSICMFSTFLGQLALIQPHWLTRCKTPTYLLGQLSPSGQVPFNVCFALWF